MTTGMLNDLGVSKHRRAELVSSGVLRVPKRGRYVYSNGPVNEIGRARMLGGAVSCTTALAKYGFWQPNREKLHLRVPRHHGSGWAKDEFANRIIADTVLHSTCREVRGVVDEWHDALLVAAACCSREELVAIIDSGFKIEHVMPWELEHYCQQDSRLREAYRLRDVRAGSGVESIVRMRLRSLRLKFDVQVVIGNWRVDFLLSGGVILEIDGFGYHGDGSAFARDRRRDRELHALGYIVLRFTYVEVMESWSRCEREILAFVRLRRKT